MRQLGVRAGRESLLRAYAIGTLGKYVPGKALVVVLRTTLAPANGTSRLHIAFTVFYETLAGMGFGALIGCACMVLVQPKPYALVIAGGGAGAAMLIVLHPAFFGRLVGLALRPFRGRTPPAVARLPGFPFVRGPAWLLGGWLLNGLSLLAALRGMGVADVGANDLALMTGASALASSLGFVAVFMPAGLGVRELILVQLLAPRLGAPTAVVASLILRTVWTAGEVMLAALLYGGVPLVRRVASRPDLPAACD